MSVRSLALFNWGDMAGIKEHLRKRGYKPGATVLQYGFCNSRQLYMYLESYDQGRKYDFHLRSFQDELYEVFKTMTIKEAYVYCMVHGYSWRSFRNFRKQLGQCHKLMSMAHLHSNTPMYLHEGRHMSAFAIAELYAPVFNYKTIASYIREHGKLDIYDVPSKSRRFAGYERLMDVCIEHKIPYDQARLLFINNFMSSEEIVAHFKQDKAA